jgi:hypothetical protein
MPLHISSTQPAGVPLTLDRPLCARDVTPAQAVSQRASLLYHLHEFLKDWDPDLFPNPRKEKEGDRIPVRFAEKVAEFPLDSFPAAVANTLAGVYGE